LRKKLCAPQPFQLLSHQNCKTDDFPTAIQRHRNRRFTMYIFGGSTQRTICMMVSVLIVTAALSLGALAAQQAAHAGYSVTITQLQ
jgi:hypothetical protein